MICHIELANARSLHKDTYIYIYIYIGEMFYILVLFFTMQLFYNFFLDY